MKKFFPYVTLPVVAFACLMFSSCGFTDASRITAVLEKCADVSHRAAKFNGNPGAQANFLAVEFQKIDVSSCPEDFRRAFQAHIFAWQQAGPALAGNSVATNALEGFVAVMTDNPGVIGGASGEAARAVQQINGTYYELTQIAAKHGARIPRSVVGN